MQAHMAHHWLHPAGLRARGRGYQHAWDFLMTHAAIVPQCTEAELKLTHQDLKVGQNLFGVFGSFDYLIYFDDFALWIY